MQNRLAGLLVLFFVGSALLLALGALPGAPFSTEAAADTTLGTPPSTQTPSTPPPPSTLTPPSTATPLTPPNPSISSTSSTATTTLNGGSPTTITTASSTTTTLAQRKFPDVPSDHSYYNAIMYLSAHEVISGFDDGTFGPSSNASRQHFAKMIVIALRLPVSEQTICAFDDVVKGGSDTLFPDNYVAVCAQTGITRGTGPGKFSPYLSISRAQVVTMIVRGIGHVAPDLLKNPPTDYQGTLGAFDQEHSPSVRLAEFNGLLSGLVEVSRSWSPWTPATRGELAQMLFNAMAKTR